MTYLTKIKLLVPVAFFGYAALGNVALFLNPDRTALTLEDPLKGGVSAQIDTLYRADLMHREPAVGLIGAARYLLLNEGRSGVVAGNSGWLYTDEEFRPLDQSSREFEATIQYIAAAKSALAAQGSELILLPLPAKLDIARAHADPAEAVRIQGEYDVFLAALDQAGITAFDTRSATNWDAQAFLRTDTHWTVEAAEDTAKHVALSGLVPLGETEFDRFDAAPVTFPGDLVSFVTTDAFAPAIGLSPETVVPFTAVAETDGPLDLGLGDEGALDLFGTGAAEGVALVGTSYSANPNWSFGEALKLHLRQDVLNYAKEGHGPVYPMAAFLKALETEAPPSVVLWEFPVRYLTDPKLFDHAKEPGNA